MRRQSTDLHLHMKFAIAITEVNASVANIRVGRFENSQLIIANRNFDGNEAPRLTELFKLLNMAICSRLVQNVYQNYRSFLSVMKIPKNTISTLP